MSSTYPFFEGGGQLGELIRNTDWTKTSFGSPDNWPDSLTSAVSIILNSGFPIAVYWGSDFSLIYNDSWSAIPGNKHPWALGKPGAEVWPEIWDGLQEEFESVLYRGASYRRPDAPLYMHRFGYTEECYFDYTLSPVKGRDGSVGGVFNAVIETSFKVINDRRNKLLMTFMNNKNVSHSFTEAIDLVNSTLNSAPEDIPFFALYLKNESGNLRLSASSNLSAVNLKALQAIDEQWLHDKQDLVLNELSFIPEAIKRHWPEPVAEVVVMPISKGDAKLKGFLMMGVSARKRFDDDCRYFMQAVGLHVGTILNNALAYELSEAFQNEQALNEELAAANEELAAANEELNATNEELQQTQDHLHSLNNELEERVEARTIEVGAERDKLKRFFMQAPAGICILSGQELVFELVNPRYQELLPERQLLGMPIFKALPEIENQPIGDILRNVLRTGEPYEGKETYIPTTVPGSDQLKDRYFNFYYQPRRDASGSVDGIMAFVYEVTDLVESRKRSEKMESSLRDLVMTAHYPLLILRGRDYVVEVTNEQLAALWGKPLKDIVGRKLLEILPELVDQPFPAFLKTVYDTGEAYGQEEEEFFVETDTGKEIKYVSFYYDPLRNENGQVDGIVVTAADITNIVKSRQLLEETFEEQQSLNEEITATNEELAAANEELQTTNEELFTTQHTLEKSLRDLAVSENRFRTLIQDAPVAIGVLRGRELIIEAANTALLRIWGKNPDSIGKTLVEALPELEGQVYLSILDQVYITGRAHRGDEAKVLLEHDGKLEEMFVNFVYQPLMDPDGNTNSIMVVAVDVSTQVRARAELEKTQDSLKMAFNAAELGSFDMDLKKGTMFWDKRCRTLFGISHDNEVNYETDFVTGLHPDDRERIVDIINNVFIKSVSNGDYDVEYRTIGVEDGKLRWLRAKGKAYFDEHDVPYRFAGAVLDITEQKLDEIRKNDFIGMVSHELKTPLTSLSAYVQVLLSKSQKQADGFTTEALTKVNQQVKRMSTMINGFLNVSRLESGKIQLEKQKFVLNELIDSIIDENKLMVNSHEISFSTCNPIVVEADMEKIGSVITNLISNAVKYSPKGKNVQLACHLENGYVKVTVQDVGMGIKKEDQDKLFERYYRVENKHAKHISGFGIGLYLSSEIVSRHHGQIGVDSTVGVGSTFWFTLPL